MRILVIQHDKDDPAGVVGEQVAARGATLVPVLPPAGDAFPDGPEGFDGLILMGGPMCAADDEGYPYYPRLHRMVRRFHDAGRPILGICLGSQIIARSFGKPVYRNKADEIGFCPVQLTDAGQADPMFKGLGSEIRPMQWHEDTFDLPDEAVRLATNEMALNQAYRIGHSTYAVQFHPEVDRDMVRTWAKSAKADEALTERLESEMKDHLAAAEHLGRTIGDRWTDLIERHGQRSAA
ncbi:MAG: type 1 glutamine amidotransferase [Alphaproteobacteria bacterium]|nr:type 1 glutamine amidotransferase [Alphaproteobacteria bacterium]